MAKIEFHKMHGLGNDFVIVDTRVQDFAVTPALAAALADRNTGIGCDQFIVIGDSDAAGLSMRIFNADGSEVEACGNATRCVVALQGRSVTIETKAGSLDGHFDDVGISVNMGRPRFAWDEIPLAYPMDASDLPLAWDDMAHGMCVNVGNPHVVFFHDRETAPDYAQLGRRIENDSVFTDRINVNFASIADGAINLVVWERGVGLTRACGTGACATAVAAIRRKLVQSPVAVHLPGGTLSIVWQEGGDIIMTGPATYAFSGQFDIDDFV